MSRQTKLRLRIDPQGGLEIVAPGWDCLALMRSLDPTFTVKSQSLPDDSEPRFLQVRRALCGYSLEQVREMPLPELWQLHADLLSRFSETNMQEMDESEASLLDIKIELTRRIMRNCTLCAQRCGVDRLAGKTGVCRLGEEALIAEHFVHIGEEPTINPSVLVSLAGCGLRCRFCQQNAILDPGTIAGEPLQASLWHALDTSGARTLSFAGGNPDESLYAILRFLKYAPHDWALPLVWNCHGAATRETISLLHGIVDVWLPDFKYGNDSCGQRLSGIRHYPGSATAAIKAMLAQQVPVIVRLLVLPDHFECCHVPVLKALSTMAPSDQLCVSIRGQYCPDWRIGPRDGALNRRPASAETAAVRSLAENLGLVSI